VSKANNRPLTTHLFKASQRKLNKSENQNLVSGLFSALENDSDLKLVVEKWSKLSVELRKAIVRMVE